MKLRTKKMTTKKIATKITMRTITKRTTAMNTMTAKTTAAGSDMPCAHGLVSTIYTTTYIFIVSLIGVCNTC